MRNGDHGFMLVWQIVGTVAFSGLVSALLRRVVEQYISAPRALILFVCLVVVISTILVARSNWNKWEPVAVTDAEVIPPTPNPTMTETNINISSTNQSGGITAHTVNVGDKPRILSPKQKLDFWSIVKDLKKGRVIVISQTHTDEALKYSESIFSMLIESGYPAELRRATNLSFPAGMILMVNPANDTVHAPALQKALRGIGVDCPGEPNDGVSIDEVWLVFGDKPTS